MNNIKDDLTNRKLMLKEKKRDYPSNIIENEKGTCIYTGYNQSLINYIDTLIDLDMTALFFSLYRQPDYFKEEEYNPERFKQYMISRRMRLLSEERAIELFDKNYSSLAYGFNTSSSKKTK